MGDMCPLGHLHPERILALVTLAPGRPAAFPDHRAAATAVDRPRAPRPIRATWWQWLDFDSPLLAQVWVICCTQIVVLVVAGLVIHASAASPY
jgi:hypothetical protein